MYQTISSPSADERVDAKFSKRGAVVCGSAVGVNFFLYGILSCSGTHEMVCVFRQIAFSDANKTLQVIT